jgi:hypothetical protein
MKVTAIDLEAKTATVEAFGQKHTVPLHVCGDRLSVYCFTGFLGRSGTTTHNLSTAIVQIKSFSEAVAEGLREGDWTLGTSFSCSSSRGRASSDQSYPRAWRSDLKEITSC